jgi:hypothetical protein
MAWPRGPRRHKYGAVATDVEGIRFPSRREAARWQALRILERAGRVCTLERQVRIPLHAPGGGLVGHYVADFRYYDVELGRTVVEDAKGVKTDVYQWKKRHVLAEHGISIQEV